MRSPRFTFQQLFRILLLGFCLLLIAPLVAAQDDVPAPQFLYRNENRLVLVNGYTGETRELPLEVTNRDQFAWSPDGQYLLVRIQEEGTYTYCINLYDVDAEVWIYDEPISCAVVDAVFSSNNTRITYATTGETNGTLWMFHLTDDTKVELYQTQEGDRNFEAGISRIEWSPTEKYLTFVGYHWIMGGTLNQFVVMDVENQTYFTVQVRDSYYAFYNPIWSEDDNWFLITLKEEYVFSGGLPHTNHEGDVYLVNSETGEQYRLTNTPAFREVDIRWLDDGRIAFTEVIQNELTYTVEEALNIEEVPEEEIITPEPVRMDDYQVVNDTMVSPDSSLGAWVASQSHGEIRSYELQFGSTLSGSQTANFSIPIQEPTYSNNILIGWRPSDYPYPQG